MTSNHFNYDPPNSPHSPNSRPELSYFHQQQSDLRGGRGGDCSDGEASPGRDEQAQLLRECRICFGRRPPFLQPCDCKGSMAHVHHACLKKWLESRHSMQCELCHFHIKSGMRLRSFQQITQGLWRALAKKFKKDKFFIIKILLYSLYIYISAKKAVSCFRLLAQQLRKRYESLSFNILSILYLIFVLVQLFMLYTSEISHIYRKLKMKLRLICYEMTF
jgi:hypothetical protein